jgi:hypothetical protein
MPPEERTQVKNLLFLSREKQVSRLRRMVAARTILLRSK